MQFIFGVIFSLYLISIRLIPSSLEEKEKFHYLAMEFISYCYFVVYFAYELFSTYELVRVK